MENDTRNLVRWSLRLKEMEFDFVNLAGIKHQTAHGFRGWKRLAPERERDLEDDISVLLLEKTCEDICCICKTWNAMQIISPMIPLVLDIKVKEKPQAPTKEELTRKHETERF